MTAMRPMTFGGDDPLRIVAIGAHADDIELGAGGTVLRLLRDRPGSSITWLVASASTERAAEARASAAAFSADAGGHELLIGDLPDGRFPSAPTAVKDLLEPLKARPIDLILAPQVDDAHQDHRLLAETVWQTFRHHVILGYEILKYDGDLGRPNVFVGLDDATLDRKAALLHEHFPSQHGRSWWGAETVRALARVRGVEAATTFAEAFYGRKILI